MSVLRDVGGLFSALGTITHHPPGWAWIVFAIVVVGLAFTYVYRPGHPY